MMMVSMLNLSLMSASFSCVSESASRSFFVVDGMGDWNMLYGKFFLLWYSCEFVVYGECVLEYVVWEFDGVDVLFGIKCAGVYWWYGYFSRVAECTAGYYNVMFLLFVDGNGDVDMVLGCEL